jgi:hypothetical protein
VSRGNVVFAGMVSFREDGVNAIKVLNLGILLDDPRLKFDLAWIGQIDSPHGMKVAVFKDCVNGIHGESSSHYILP